MGAVGGVDKKWEPWRGEGERKAATYGTTVDKQAPKGAYQLPHSLPQALACHMACHKLWHATSYGMPHGLPQALPQGLPQACHVAGARKAIGHELNICHMACHISKVSYFDMHGKNL